MGDNVLLVPSPQTGPLTDAEALSLLNMGPLARVLFKLTFLYFTGG